MLSILITLLLILLPKVVLAKGLITKLEISLPRVVILEGVSILEVDIKIVNKFLLRVSLKILSI